MNTAAPFDFLNKKVMDPFFFKTKPVFWSYPYEYSKHRIPYLYYLTVMVLVRASAPDPNYVYCILKLLQIMIKIGDKLFHFMMNPVVGIHTIQVDH